MAKVENLDRINELSKEIKKLNSELNVLAKFSSQSDNLLIIKQSPSVEYYYQLYGKNAKDRSLLDMIIENLSSSFAKQIKELEKELDLL
jgi:hypothetical protein